MDQRVHLYFHIFTFLHNGFGQMVLFSFSIFIFEL